MNARDEERSLNNFILFKIILKNFKINFSKANHHINLQSRVQVIFGLIARYWIVQWSNCIF